MRFRTKNDTITDISKEEILKHSLALGNKMSFAFDDNGNKCGIFDGREINKVVMHRGIVTIFLKPKGSITQYEDGHIEVAAWAEAVFEP
jgi:hypothetical protein